MACSRRRSHETNLNPSTGLAPTISGHVEAYSARRFQSLSIASEAKLVSRSNWSLSSSPSHATASLTTSRPSFTRRLSAASSFFFLCSFAHQDATSGYSTIPNEGSFLLSGSRARLDLSRLAIGQEEPRRWLRKETLSIASRHRAIPPACLQAARRIALSLKNRRPDSRRVAEQKTPSLWMWRGTTLTGLH